MMNKDEFEQYDSFERSKSDSRWLAPREEQLSPTVSFGVGVFGVREKHGRWEELTLEDLQFLHDCGINPGEYHENKT